MDPSVASAAADIARACHWPGSDVAAFRKRLLDRMRRFVTIDAAFFATVDPATLLFTGAWAESPLGPAGPRFLDNEFGTVRDVNRFADLARARRPVMTLDEATHGRRARSARFREILTPLGMGDELRVALRVGGTTWGVICMHREGRTGFSAREIELVRRIAPHAGTSLRRMVRAAFAGPDPAYQEPATIVVSDDHVTAVTDAASAWMEELGWAPVQPGDALPFPALTVARRLRALDGSAAPAPPPRLTLLTARGSVVDVCATRLRGDRGDAAVAITFGAAQVQTRSALRFAAYGLTPAQRRVAELVLQGRSTRAMVHELGIGEHTVQDHLKAVFDQVGVRSRRELVAAMMR